MTTNKYIDNFTETCEQNLLEDLVIEQIQFYGHDFYYVPREIVNRDTLFTEDLISKFDDAYVIEMQIFTVDGYEGEGHLLSRFGITINDSADVIVSKRRFTEAVTAFNSVVDQPREGDLIFFPMTAALFEITFVEHENPFYQLGKEYVFRITMQKFEYSQEDLDTDITEIDQFETDFMNKEDPSNDPFADNDSIQTEGEGIVNFDETDPFSENNY